VKVVDPNVSSTLNMTVKSLCSCTLKMEVACPSKTLVTTYTTVWRSKPHHNLGYNDVFSAELHSRIR
jgi:hypothetical protein